MKLYATDMFFRGDTDKEKASDCCVHGKIVYKKQKGYDTQKVIVLFVSRKPHHYGVVFVIQKTAPTNVSAVIVETTNLSLGVFRTAFTSLDIV